MCMGDAFYVAGTFYVAGARKLKLMWMLFEGVGSVDAH